MSRRPARILGLLALQAVALVLAHELVFLARWGSRYNEALVHAGHGDSWSAAVAMSVVLGVGLIALATFRLARLGLLVQRRAAAAGVSRGALSRVETTAVDRLQLLTMWLRVGPRTALLTAALLTIQENLEHAAIGQASAGPSILLSPEYAGGLWIALAVGLVVGFVMGLFEWRRKALLARLLALRGASTRGAIRAASRTGVSILPPVESLLGRRSALRAPPALVSSSLAG